MAKRSGIAVDYQKQFEYTSMTTTINEKTS